MPLTEQAYQQIKRMIVTCELPPNSMVKEDVLKETLGMSRTPVREALQRLAMDDLIVVYPRRGMLVAPVTIRQVKEVFQIREIIEVQIALQVIDSIDLEPLRKFYLRFNELEQSKVTLSDNEYYDLDFSFHRMIVAASHNQYIVDFMEKVYDKDYRIRVLTTRTAMDRKEGTMSEHLVIVDAFINRDRQTLQEALTSHIKKSFKAAIANAITSAMADGDKEVLFP